MKVGEYARLNSTLYNTVVILKIMGVYDNTILTENDGSIFQGEYGKDEIINHSYNIIDLIEVGDIIKGKDEHLFEVYAVGSDCVYINNLKEFILADEIKSIVTHEQIESMEYKI